MAQQVWGQGDGEDQAGAASADSGEGTLRDCCYLQEKLLSEKSKVILMTQDTTTKCQQSWVSNYVGVFAGIRCGRMISLPPTAG